MKISRLFVGATLTVAVLTAWLGGCGSDDNEACGNAGDKSGVCKLGPSCPSGSTEISISDPDDECPGSNTGNSYICCQSSDGGGAVETTDSAAPTPDAATKG